LISQRTINAMKALLDVAAPAKLNLFLHIIGVRADGYHLLQSVFVLLNLCDTLDIETCKSNEISRTDDNPGDALPANDLVVRAAQLLQQATGTQRGAHIRLRKRIPMQAGLGGGSSDAASCLMALNRLWGTGLSRSELSELGVKLGADVPFFLLGNNAWVEGIGEKLAPIDLPEQAYLVVKPDAGLATSEIFNAPDLKRDTEAAIMRGFAECSVEEKLRFGRNDLQPVAQRICPDIGASIGWLNGLGLSARMTGSGSSVFAPVHDAMNEVEAPKGNTIFHCESLLEHPLKSWII
jgi:4-diphosphocytidyl-2-C-methyl-D-erythritol kinase